MERGGEGAREARGVEAHLVGVLTGGGEAWRSGDVIDHGGRGAAMMDTATQGIPCSVEDGHGSLVVWIRGGGE